MNKYFEIKTESGEDMAISIVPFKSIDNILICRDNFDIETKEEHYNCRDFKQLANYKTWLNNN